MLATLSQICSLNSAFEKDIEDYAAGHCTSIELWLTKLEEYLKNHSVADTKQLLKDHGVTTPVASYQGGLFVGEGPARDEAWNLFKHRLDLCQELGVDVFVVACDIAGPLSQSGFESIHRSLAKMAEEARQRDVRLALEFQAKSVFGNNLQTVAALVDQVANPHLGICLDLFHLFVGPSQNEDLAYTTKENLFHVQLCDLADVPRELASDSDRILPGEGDIPVAAVIDHLRSIGYERAVSIELMNPQIWQIPALQFGEIGMTALRKLLGQAEMGA